MTSSHQRLGKGSNIGVLIEFLGNGSMQSHIFYSLQLWACFWLVLVVP